MPQDKRRPQLLKKSPLKVVLFLVLGAFTTMVARAIAIAEPPEPPHADMAANISSQHQESASPTDYQVYELPQAMVHVVTVRNLEAVSLSIAVADELETVDDIARNANALAAINAGFFDPQNGKTTSYLVSQGDLVGDPANNERLVDNPSLQTYLPHILNRSEFRFYRCDNPNAFPFGIAFHSDPVPANCQVEEAVGAGPQLLPQETSTEEAFIDTANGEIIRDAIGSRQPNARSAVGIISNTQEIVLIMAAQREDAPGFRLAEMADFAQTLGVDALLNLDGGSSSTLYYDGQTYFARLDAEGNPIERPVKSVILIK